MKKYLVILITLIIIVFLVLTVVILLATKVKDIPPTNVSTLDKTHYLVITRKEGEYSKLADYVSSKKNNAPILYYNENLDELVPEIRKLSPEYVAIVESPNQLTYQFLSSLIPTFTKIDNDIYLDTSIGIITARSLELGYDYVDKLIIQSGKDLGNILSTNIQAKLTQTLIDNVKTDSVKDYCSNTVQSGSVYCPKGYELATNDIPDLYQKSNVILFNLHGTPSAVTLDEGEISGGNKLHVKSSSSDKENILVTNASLVYANSCLTTRVTGVSSTPKYSSYPAENNSYIGYVDSSLVLSFLDAGALNFIGSHNFSNTVISPDRELIYDSLLSGKPLGETIKDYFNKYTFLAEVISKDRLGAPKADTYTIQFVKDMASTWLLFGDPEFSFSSQTKDIQNTCEKKLDTNTYEIAMSSLDQELDYSNISIYNSISEEGEFFTEGCFLSFKPSIPTNSYRVSITGINEEYANSYSPEGELTANLGDEVFVLLPKYHLSPANGRSKITIDWDDK